MSVKNAFKIAGLSGTIWLVANIINAVIASMLLAVTGSGSMLHEVFALVLVFSAMFSLPGLLLFMLIFLLIRQAEWLFEKLLFTSLVLSVASVLLLAVIEPDFPLGELWWTMIPAATGAAAATALHRRYIQRFSDSMKVITATDDRILTGDDI